MRFTFSCTRCGSILEASEDLSGHQGRCPTCGGVFRVPEVDRRTGLARGPAQVADDGQLPTPMHAYATAGVNAPKILRLPNGHQVIVCPRCQRQMPVDADVCKSCGIPFTLEGAAEISTAGEENSGLATAALTVGVLSIPTFCFPLLGVVAVILGFVALRRAAALGSRAPGRRMALAGIACGVLSLGVYAVTTFW